MGLSGCYGVVKFLILLINLLFWLVGFGVVLLAVWMLVDPTSYVSMAQDHGNYYIGVYIFLVGGVVMLIAAFLGCCGAFKESQCLLISFFSCLLVILVAEIAAGAWAYYNADSLENLIRSSVKTTVQKEYGIVNSRTETMDMIQRELECCGANGPSDWNGSEFNKKGKNEITLTISQAIQTYNIPQSCCKRFSTSKECELGTNVVFGAIISSSVHSQGCMDKLVHFLKENATTVYAVALAVIVVEVIGLIFALILCFAVNRSDRYKA